MSTENWLLFTPYVGASEQGGWEGAGPPRIGELYSKNLKNQRFSPF